MRTSVSARGILDLRKVGALALVVVGGGLLPVTALGSALDPVYDARLNATCLPDVRWPDVSDVQRFTHEAIPKQIFQIWFGSQSSPWHAHMAAWEALAQEHGYAYRLYTEADIPEILEDAAPQVTELLFQLKFAGEYRGMSDLARYLILEAQGGLYVDADMRVPRRQNEAIDPATFMPLRGLVVVSDGAPVDWGVGGLHVLNGIIASAPRHPVIMSMLDHVVDNVHCCRAAGQSSAVLQTGPALLTLLLNGPVTVVPTIFWETFGIPDPEWR